METIRAKVAEMMKNTQQTQPKADAPKADAPKAKGDDIWSRIEDWVGQNNKKALCIVHKAFLLLLTKGSSARLLLIAQ